MKHLKPVVILKIALVALIVIASMPQPTYADRFVTPALYVHPSSNVVLASLGGQHTFNVVNTRIDAYSVQLNTIPLWGDWQWHGVSTTVTIAPNESYSVTVYATPTLQSSHYFVLMLRARATQINAEATGLVLFTRDQPPLGFYAVPRSPDFPSLFLKDQYRRIPYPPGMNTAILELTGSAYMSETVILYAFAYGLAGSFATDQPIKRKVVIPRGHFSVSVDVDRSNSAQLRSPIILMLFDADPTDPNCSYVCNATFHGMAFYDFYPAEHVLYLPTISQGPRRLYEK